MPALMTCSAVNVEAALLVSDRSALKQWRDTLQGDDAQQIAIRLATLVADGEYAAVLRNDVVADLIGTSTTGTVADLCELVQGRRSHYLAQGSDGNEVWWQAICMLAGVACLNAFIQSNVTGPPLEEDWSAFLPADLRGDTEATAQMIVKSLSTDGEECYKLAVAPYYIYMARILLCDPDSAMPGCVTARWWYARYCHWHQHLLSDWANTLYTSYKGHMDAVLESLASFPTEVRTDLTIRAHVEYGIMGYYYQDVSKEMSHVVQAQQLSGLVLEMTGVLGRRTRWQAFDTPQLVLKAKSDAVRVTPDGDGETSSRPANVKLNDDTLLEEIEFSEAVTDQSDLAVLDQCIILASCLNVKNSNPTHGLTTEQMMPFVERVLTETNKTHNWGVFSTGLLLRSRLEAEKSRTVERSAMQMQVLVDQFKDDLGRKEAAAWQRLEYIHCLAFPTLFNMQRELGQRYVSIGVVKSAQELFERLEMWEDVIGCLVMMEERTKALALCRQELAKDKTPRLLCVLGDLTGDKDLYREAWALSGGRFTRAMRSLGRLLLQEGDAAGCVECLGKALDINPLNDGAWFTMGCAALRCGEWNTAVRAFRRCIAIDEENGEAWNNLATAYIKLNENAKAAQALQQALRYSYDNWQMWENYLNVTTDVHDYTASMRAIHRLIEIRPQKFDDILAVNVNMQSVIDAIQEMGDDQHSKDSLAKKWGEVLARCQSIMSQNAEIWVASAEWYKFKGDHDKVIDCMQKALRVSQKTGWEKEADAFTTVATRALDLADLYFDKNTVSSAHSARLMLRSLVKKTDELYGSTDAHAQLREALDKAEALEVTLKQHIA